MKNKVDEFIKAKVLSEYRKIVDNFRQLISKDYPFLVEEMRGGTENYYGVPVYRNKRIIITISPTKKGITFSFTDGKAFEDKFSLLEGEGNKTLIWRISKETDFDDEKMKYYIEQAIAIDNDKDNK